jgi:hypothetical protein
MVGFSLLVAMVCLIVSGLLEDVSRLLSRQICEGGGVVGDPLGVGARGAADDLFHLVGGERG